MSDMILTIGDRELNQEECALIAFRFFEHLAYDLDVTLHKWRLFIEDEGFPRSDLVFLLLYFFDHNPEESKKLDLVVTLLRKELKKE